MGATVRDGLWMHGSTSLRPEHVQGWGPGMKWRVGGGGGGWESVKWEGWCSGVWMWREGAWCGRGVKWEVVCDGRGQTLRIALHTMNTRLQNSLCESHTWRLMSWKAIRELNALWALPVYTIFEDEKSKWSDEKLVNPGREKGGSAGREKGGSAGVGLEYAEFRGTG